MQIRAVLNLYHISVRIAVIKEKKIINAADNVDKWQLSFNAKGKEEK